MSIPLIRLIPAVLFILAGIFILFCGTFGIFRIHYALNRLHSAAMPDSLGMFFFTAGIVCVYGFSFSSLKTLILLIIFWSASPVGSHLLSSLEAETNPNLVEKCEIITISGDAGKVDDETIFPQFTEKGEEDIL